MNTDQENLAAALREIANGSRRNKTARLRECFDDVEAAKAAGASNKTIVAALEANGLFFDVNNFKNARSRILKERAIEALTQASLLVKEIEPSNTSLAVTPEKIPGALVPTANSLTQTSQIQRSKPERKNIQTESTASTVRKPANSAEFISNEDFKKVGDDIDLTEFS